MTETFRNGIKEVSFHWTGLIDKVQHPDIQNSLTRSDMVVLSDLALLKIVVELKEHYVTMRTWNSYPLLPPFP